MWRRLAFTEGSEDEKGRGGGGVRAGGDGWACGWGADMSGIERKRTKKFGSSLVPFMRWISDQRWSEGVTDWCGRSSGDDDDIPSRFTNSHF
jgi:hypothetical protein